MGMSRETYERKFREFFAEVLSLVDEEVQQWKEHQIEVRKKQINPDEFIYVVEWQGRALNAFALEFHTPHPYIALYYDANSHAIAQLPTKPSKKEMELNTFRDLLIFFMRSTIIAEAKKVALQEGFFSRIVGNNLRVFIGSYEFTLEYWVKSNIWEVRCTSDPKVLWEKYPCGNQHPVEFLASLLKSLALKVLL